jgi:hypothetical protein
MAITNGYVTLSEVKLALRINDNEDNDLLELSIEAASREIDGYCERVFYNAGTASRVYIPTDNFLTETDDLVTLTQLRTSSTGESFDTTWNLSTDVQLEPLNGVSGGLVQPYTRLRAIGDYLFPVWDPRNVNANEATVQVTGVYGWASVPKAIKQAALLLSLRQFKRYDSPLGVAGFGDIGVVRVGRFDPDVESLVAPFRKVRMA